MNGASASETAPLRVLIVAGEASGDLHGGNLIRAAEALPGRPIRFFGVGGEEMRAAGAEILIDAAEMEAVGIPGPAKLRTIHAAFSRLKDVLARQRPDAVVLIDYAEFNMAFAKAAKRAGVKTIYYIAPQVWAWRRGRARKIARRTDRVLSIIPFEPEFYGDLGAAVEYVGHPLVDKVAPEVPPAQVESDLGLAGASPRVLLMPGSRAQEIERVLPPMAGAAEILASRYPEAAFVLPLASTADAGEVQRCLPAGLPVRLVRKNRYAAMALCDVGLVCSGTATLETALLGVPMAIAYKAPPLLWRLRFILAVRTYGIVNLIAERPVCPELIQGDCTPERLAEEAVRLLEDAPRRSRAKEGLAEVRRRLGPGGASENAARALRRALEGGR